MASVVHNMCGILFFLDTRVLLCDFHREQAWSRQVKQKDMGLDETKSEQSRMLAHLRRIARARYLTAVLANLYNHKGSSKTFHV